MMKWFAANNLVPNLDKMNIMKFITKNLSHSTLCIGCKEKYIEKALTTELLGLKIDDHLTWKNHIEQMISKLSEACSATWWMVHISNINTLKSIYYEYFYSVIKYGIIFGGNSCNSGKIFTLQKNIFRIMASAQPRPSCRSLFKQSEILPVPCQHTLLLMNFTINNNENFQTNSCIHNSNNTRHEHHLHGQNASLSCFQKSTSYAGIKIFSSLASSLTIPKIGKAKFKAATRKYLKTHSFCSVHEFYMCKDGP